MRLPRYLFVTLLIFVSLLIGTAACRMEAPSRVEAPTDSSAQTVSFELLGPGDAALVVPVHLNGRGPFPFVLDTGATLTCINQSLSDSLGLPQRTGMFGTGAGVGGTGNVQMVAVDSLRLGQTQAFDLTACELDLANLQTAGIRVDGLLGLNFLKSFRMTLDFGARTVQLEKL